MIRLWLRKLKTASTLSLSEWHILATAYFCFFKTYLHLWLHPQHYIDKLLTVRATPSSQSGAGPHRLSELMRIFHIARSYQFQKPKCLATSLAQQTFLASFGIPATFHIGVKNEKGKFEAHAWCESESDPKEGRTSRPGPFQVMEPLQ